MTEMITITKRKTRHYSEMKDAPVAGKVYNLPEAAKAAQMGVSSSYLQKDRLKPKPEVDFKRYGRMVRYSAD